jgi:hypothetical protein
MLGAIAALTVVTSGAIAQKPDAPRSADPATAVTTAMRRPPLTEAQQLVNELPPPQEGFGGGWATHAPDAPMPSADPRDLQGTWSHGQDLEIRNAWDMYGLRTPFSLTGAKTVVRRLNGKRNAKPYVTLAVKCLPPGPLWQLDINAPFQIFQSRDWLEIMAIEFHGRWRMAFDEKFLPATDQKEYQGRSVAHWDGNTLVVETTNFKQDLWLDSDGVPLSRNGKMVTRIRKVDNGDRRPYLEMVHTFFDPVNYTNPWSIVRMFNWAPERTLFREYNCEEQTGDPSGITDAGFLVDEPSE